MESTEQDELLIAQFQQLCPQQWSSGQVERLGQFIARSLSDFLRLRRLIQGAAVLHGKGNPQLWLNDLDRFAVDLIEPPAQALVASDDGVDATLQSLAVKFAAQPQGLVYVVLGAVFLQLGNKPQPLLCVGERQPRRPLP